MNLGKGVLMSPFPGAHDGNGVNVNDSGLEFVSEEHTFKNLSVFQKIMELTGICWVEMQSNPVLFISIIGGSITRLIGVLFSTYLIIWI